MRKYSFLQEELYNVCAICAALLDGYVKKKILVATQTIHVMAQ